MAKNKITDVVGEVLTPFLREQGLLLYHVEYVKEGPDRILRAFIDREKGGIGTEDCELVSRFLSDKLDELDPIEDNYVLEVSSPGLDRELITEEHFKRYMGEIVEISLYKEQDGQKKFQGTLKSYDEGDVTVTLDSGETKVFKKKDIAKTNLAVII